MLNMNERMNASLFNLNYKIINIVRLFNFTRSAILPHNLPKLYSTGRFSWSTICYCAGGRGLKVLNGTRPVEYTQWRVADSRLFAYLANKRTRARAFACVHWRAGVCWGWLGAGRAAGFEFLWLILGTLIARLGDGWWTAVFVGASTRPFDMAPPWILISS